MKKKELLISTILLSTLACFSSLFFNQKTLQTAGASNVNTTVKSHLDTRLSNTTYYVIKLTDQNYFDGTTSNSNKKLDETLINNLGVLSSIKINGSSLNTYSTTFSDFDFTINYHTLGGFCFKVPTINDVSKVTSFEVVSGTMFPIIGADGTISDSHYVTTERYYFDESLFDIKVNDLDVLDVDLKIKSIDDFAREQYGYFFLRFENDGIYSQNIKNQEFNILRLTQFNILEKIKIDGKPLKSFSTNILDFNFTINKWARWNALAFIVPGIEDTRDISSFVVEVGCQIPAENYTEEVYEIKTKFEYINPDYEFGYEIPDNSLRITTDTDFVTFTIKTSINNVTSTNAVDASKILINDVVCSQIRGITLSYRITNYVLLQIKLTKNNSILLNVDSNYFGNKIVIQKGLKITNTISFLKSYRICIYDLESITEIYDPNKFDNYVANAISGITFTSHDSDGNALFTVKFSEAIVGDRILYAATPESWKDTNLSTYKDGVYHNRFASRSFMHVGYKSSLLDNLLINGKSVSEIYYSIPKTVNARNYVLMIHYGFERKTQMNIIISKACSDYINEIRNSYNNGTLTFGVKAGLVFPSQTVCNIDEQYKLNKNTNSFIHLTNNDFAVYYNGQNVQNNDLIESNSAFLESNIALPNNGVDYSVSVTDEAENIKQVSIKDGQLEVLSFKVKTTLNYAPEIKNNTNLIIIIAVAGSVVVVTIAIIVIITTIRRKKHE